MMLTSVLLLIAPLVVGVLSYEPFKQSQGLSKEDRQLLLDSHNAWRAHVAAGKEKNAPPSEYMTALEWDDRLEEGAQIWADKCKFTHNNPQENKFKPYFEIGQSITGMKAYLKDQGIERLTHDWYKEVKDYDYNSNHCNAGKVCGHYTAMVHANTTLFGCGYNRCEGRGMAIPYIVCHYASAGNIVPISVGYQKDVKQLRPYVSRSSGQACSHCPQQFGYCMDNALCATHASCQNTKSNCKCMIRSCQGGRRFNQRECKCECPPGKEGLQCEKSCADVWNTRKCQGMEHNCYFTKAWRLMRDACSTTCGKYCGVFQIPDPGHTNRNRVQTNVVKAVVPAKIDNSKKYPKGPCKNQIDTKLCNSFYDDDLCKTNAEWMDYYCPSVCQTCDKQAPRPGCMDIWEKSDCEPRVGRGKCGKKDYMTSFCAKSCGLCDKKASWTHCVDPADHDCPTKAAHGDCKNSITARADCPGSCNSCQAKRVRGACKNLDPDTKCEERALYGMCFLNPRRNLKFCQGTCAFCQYGPKDARKIM